MPLQNDIDRAKQVDRSLMKKLNQEESWVERHPGWMTSIVLVLSVAMLTAIVKGCH